MFSGLTDKIKSSLGLPTIHTETGSYESSASEQPTTPAENAPAVEEDEEAVAAEEAEPEVVRQPIPGSALLEHMENRQQMLALRRRQTVMVS